MVQFFTQLTIIQVPRDDKDDKNSQDWLNHDFNKGAENDQNVGDVAKIKNSFRHNC